MREVLANRRSPEMVRKTPTKRGRKLADQALDDIRSRIIDGSIALGEAISETSLAAALNVSKTPVREALQELKREGLVQIFPKRGTYVFEASRELVQDLCEFRRILESEALERSMRMSWGRLVDHMEPIVESMATAIEDDDLRSYRKLDSEFHQGIVLYCDNRFLQEAHAAIEFRVQALRTRLSITPENNNQTLVEHQAIVASIASRDSQAAITTLESHLEQTRECYLKQFNASDQF